MTCSKKTINQEQIEKKESTNNQLKFIYIKFVYLT